jgi:beta-glucosidase
MSRSLTFPEGFRWGTASSSHQTEGNNHNNQWSRFEQQPGAIARGHRSGIACNWWENAEADFDRIAALGLNTHRLSLEWSRIEPRPGHFDENALQRYRQMLLALHERGIQPWIALHHFTNPLWLEDKGGWEKPSIIERFATYAQKVVAHLGDLCQHWLTINEPMIYLGHGWMRGTWPPHRRNPLLAMRVYRHMLYAHAAAYHTIHAAQPKAQVSVAKAMRHFDPARPTHPGDRLAALLRRHLFEDLWFQATVYGHLLPPLGRGQFDAALANTLDFIGINYYARYQVTFSPNPAALFGRDGYTLGRPFSDSTSRGPYSQFDPDGLAIICQRLQRYGKPLYITEHGLPDQDDDQRPLWIVAQLAELHRAMQAGCNIRGYFHWTLVDNFEWNDGWTMHFGLISMDVETQTRTPRPSASIYGEIARTNQLSAELLRHYGLEHYITGSNGEK